MSEDKWIEIKVTINFFCPITPKSRFLQNVTAKICILQILDIGQMSDKDILIQCKSLFSLIRPKYLSSRFSKVQLQKCVFYIFGTLVTGQMSDIDTQVKIEVNIIFLMFQNPQVQIFKFVVAKMSLLHIWDTGHQTNVRNRCVG